MYITYVHHICICIYKAYAYQYGTWCTALRSVQRRDKHYTCIYNTCVYTYIIHMQINIYTYIQRIRMYIYHAYAHQYDTWRTTLRSVQTRDKHYKCTYNTCVYTHTFHMQINIHTYIQRIRIYIYKAYAYQYGTWCTALRSVQRRDKQFCTRSPPETPVRMSLHVRAGENFLCVIACACGREFPLCYCTCSWERISAQVFLGETVIACACGKFSPTRTWINYVCHWMCVWERISA